MSNLDTRHNVVPFVAGKSTALTGQELIAIRYKSSIDKKTKAKIPAKFPSVCVSVPKLNLIDIRERMDILFDLVSDALNDARKGIVQHKYEESEGKLTGVSDEELSIAACVEWMDSQGRMTKEDVATWFVENCAPILTAGIAEKMQHAEDSTAVIEQVGIRADAILQAAVGKGLADFDPELRKLVQRTIEVCELEDDPIARRILRRITPRKSKEQKKFTIVDF